MNAEHAQHGPREVLGAVAPYDARLLTPALVVDLGAVDHNVEAMLTRAGSEHWRPHLKTTKQSVIIARMLDRGVRNFKVATPHELHLLVSTAAEVAVDVIVAFPLLRASFDAVARIAAAMAWTRCQT